MACCCYFPSRSIYIGLSLPFLRKSSASRWQRPISIYCSNQIRTAAYSATLSANSFTWDDVLRVSASEIQLSDLSGFFEKINICNRNIEKQSEFLPFVVEGQIVGYVHSGFAENLRRFPDVFLLLQDGLNNGFLSNYVTLNPKLETPEDRTSAVGNVIRCLGELIPGIRDELYPVVRSFGEQAFFSLERAAAPYFGIKAYGVHMNGYVEKGRQEFLWLAKRSQVKPTFPGMLDHLVAGGLPHGISCDENMIKECEEEAGIPKSISKNLKSVGAVSYIDIDGYRFKRDVLFCYDLKLPEDFIPANEDGEVESFKLVPVSTVANVIRRTHLFKPNCSLVIIDFLFRHGYGPYGDFFVDDAIILLLWKANWFLVISISSFTIEIFLE